MPNPNPKTAHLSPAPMVGDKPLAPNGLTVKVPQEVDAVIRSMPNRSEWLRRVITEAAQRELLNPSDEVKP